MTDTERLRLIRAEPNAAPLIRPYVGSDEHINGGDRWLLTLHGVSPSQLRPMQHVMDIVEQVRKYRLGLIPSRNKPGGKKNQASALSLALAKTPTEFHVTVIPEGPFLAIPEVSSERREYLPIGWLEPPIVPSNKLLIALNVELYQFALITSKMHMAWVRYIGGRLKSDYQYSTGINYNPFPWPDLTETDKSRLSILAQAVLDARLSHPEASLGDLYDPDIMPLDLRRAHHALDIAVDRLYRSQQFAGDRERVEHLFKLYENMTAPMLLAARTKPKRTRAVSNPSVVWGADG